MKGLFFEYDDFSKTNRLKLKPIILILFIVLLILVLFAIFKEEKRNKKVIIMDDLIPIEYNDNKFEYIKDDSYLKLSYNLFYLNNKYLDNKIINKDNNIYTFKSNNKKTNIDVSSAFLAMTPNMTYIIKKDEIVEKEDIEIINKVKENSNIYKLEDISSSSKITLDFDNDGINETLYSVTYEDTNKDDIGATENDYSIIFYKKNDDVILIKEGKTFDNGVDLSLEKYKIHSIIDLENDKEYELLISNLSYDEPTYDFYKIINGKYELFFSYDKR